MQNLRFLIRNLADTATVVELPALVATLPGTNLQRMTERGRTARTTSLAAQALVLQWASSVELNMQALTRHNMTPSGTLRWWRALAGSPTFYSSDSGSFAALVTSGLDTDIDIYSELDFSMLRNSARYHSALSGIHEVRVDMADATNPDGFMEAHRIWAGKYKTVTYDPPFGGVDIQIVDDSKQERVDDGTMLVDKKWKARKITLRLDFIPEADLKWLLAAARYLGKDKELFISVYPEDSDSAKELYGQMACRLVDSPTFNHHQVGLFKNTMTFEET